MKHEEITALAERFLDAWNSQDVERVVACYTDDVVYRDPNTRGAVTGADAMRRYLGKLFASWTMHWSLREAFPIGSEEGAAVLWRATLKNASTPEVTVDGMDLVLLAGERIRRNEVYFDRVALIQQLR